MPDVHSVVTTIEVQQCWLSSLDT